jgi:hypothetical protein
MEEDKEAFAGLFTGNLDGAPPKPQRPQLIQFFSRKFYETRIRERFEARMAGIVCRAAFTEDDVPAVLKVRNDVTKEVWDEETEAFQAEVKATLEKEYQASLAGWKSSLADSPTKSPEEMNAYVSEVQDMPNLTGSLGLYKMQPSICNLTWMRSKSASGCVRRCFWPVRSGHGGGRLGCEGRPCACARAFDNDGFTTACTPGRRRVRCQ